MSPPDLPLSGSSGFGAGRRLRHACAVSSRAALAPLSCRFWIGAPCVERDTSEGGGAAAAAAKGVVSPEVFESFFQELMVNFLELQTEFSKLLFDTKPS